MTAFFLFSSEEIIIQKPAECTHLHVLWKAAAAVSPHSCPPVIWLWVDLTDKYLWADQTNQISRRRLHQCWMLCDVANHPVSLRKHHNHLSTHMFQWKGLSCSRHWQHEWNEDMVVYLSPTPFPPFTAPPVCCQAGLDIYAKSTVASKVWQM